MGKAFLYGQSGGGSPLKIPEYTGDHTIYGDAKKGYMVITSSGDFTPTTNMNIDVFLVGGGGSGGYGRRIAGSGEDYSSYNGGNGGGGGYTRTIYNIAAQANLLTPVIIGAGGVATASSPAAGGITQFNSAFEQVAGGVYNGGSGGGRGGERQVPYVTRHSTQGGSDGSGGVGGGGAGQGTTTRPFDGLVYPFTTMLFSGGGGGGGADDANGSTIGRPGGAGGGGDGSSSNSIRGTDAVVATGGGGGGGACMRTASGSLGGNGGSGICIIRWGDWSTGMEA